MKTIFFGSSNFSLPILEYLVENTQLLFVVLKTNKNVIANYVKENNIKYILYEDLKISDLNAVDFNVVASFSKIIPDDIINNFRCINVHASLLPLLRGATPIQMVLKLGYKSSGVSIIEMTNRLDEGDILSQKSVKINYNDNRETLEYKMGLVGGEILIDTLYNIDRIKKKKQDNNLASYCYKKDFSRDKGRILWDNSAENVRNQIRAFYPAWSIYDGKNMNIKEASITEQKSSTPGEILRDSKDLLISCSDLYLKIDSIQQEGRNYITGREFKNGIHNDVFKFD